MTETYQCADCEDSFHNSLVSLLKHKTDECLDAKVCRNCHTNVSEYNLMKHIMSEIEPSNKVHLPPPEKTQPVKVVCSLCEKHRNEVHNFPYAKDFQIGGKDDKIFSFQISDYAKKQKIPMKVVSEFLDGIGKKSKHLIGNNGTNNWRGWLGVKFSS